MDIVNFETKHIREAMELARAAYYEERQHVMELPQIDDIPDLYDYVENGLGVAAFDNGKMTGFLCCCEPFDNAFRATDVRGVFSPMGANAAVSKNRSKIYAAMYQAAGEKWIKTGAVSHAVCLYAHDEELQRQFFQYGFGLRCIDAIRPMELIDCEPCTGYDLVELSKEEFPAVYPLHLALYRHYCESPFFMNRKPESQEEFVASSLQDGGRYFAAKRYGKLCAFLKISVPGETFITTDQSYQHINGAYCLPEHRGRGLYQNLLNFAIAVLKREGYTRLGVDFESFNPSGRGFWLKYFAAYTNGVVRRIDERIIEKNGKPYQ